MKVWSTRLAKEHSVGLNAEGEGRASQGVGWQEQPGLLSCHLALLLRICEGNIHLVAG